MYMLILCIIVIEEIDRNISCIRNYGGYIANITDHVYVDSFPGGRL